jgi:hypothetical protein
MMLFGKINKEGNGEGEWGRGKGKRKGIEVKTFPPTMQSKYF